MTMRKCKSGSILTASNTWTLGRNLGRGPLILQIYSFFAYLFDLHDLWFACDKEICIFNAPPTYDIDKDTTINSMHD